MKLSQIQMRDPFVLPHASEQTYYLYGTTDTNCWVGKGQGFDVYASKDLENWDGPYPAFRPAPDFWADQNYWAPEVFLYQNKYYMFASFKSDQACRGTQILIADHPLGPFVPHSDGPVTPRYWECLDGTLYLDQAGDPWMIFCHEWVQVRDGEMHALRLSPDLSHTIGEPQLLFKASAAPWVRPSIHRNEDGSNNYVTDGPFLFYSSEGQLQMLWSSRGEVGYAMGIARSISSKISGPWEQEASPIYGQDGGHGMIFRSFIGDLMMTIHTPNSTPNERPVFLRLKDVSGRLIVDI